MSSLLRDGVAVYPGTFDPVHRGHLDVISRGCKVFERIIVGVGWNSVVGAWDFGTIDFRLKPHAGRWESGALNLAGIFALGASLELLLGAGIDSVASRVFELTDYLCEAAGAAGLEVYSSRRQGEKSGIVSLLPPADADPRVLVHRLRQEGVVVNQRAGRLRVSPHAYNTPDEVDRLVDLLGEKI